MDPVKRPQGRAPKRWEKAVSVPFLSEESMTKPLSCSLADFKTPLLRKCQFDLTSIKWGRSRRIIGGLDGYTWKIRLHGHDRPYAMKMFWDAEPGPEFHRYHAPQRECQNNAILQLIRAAIEDVESPPIRINPEPKTRRDALKNTFMFSREGRQTGLSNVDFEPMTISSMPRMRRCYGWVKINRSVLNTWPRNARPISMEVEKIERTVSSDKDHVAIIYEYIDESDNDPAVVEAVTDFLWRVGFGYTTGSLARNWKNGILIDFSDIVHAGGYGWHDRLYGPRKADQILKWQGY